MAANAEVIDLDAGPRGGRVTAGVLDFDRPTPFDLSVPESPTVVVAARSAPAGRMPIARPEIDAMITEVGAGYAGHPALRRAGLGTVEWLRLFRANIAIESNFKVNARSPVGAIGLGQLMPGTAVRLGVNPHDPVQNLHGSARYLLAQMERFGSAELALAAYNAGPEAVAKHSGIPPYRETIGHVRKVMSLFNSP